jgi:hypothetical protein
MSKTMPAPETSNAVHSSGDIADRRNIFLARAALGLVLSLAALGVAGHDLAVFIGTNRYDPTTAGRMWFELHVGSLNLAQAIVQRYVHPGLWDPIAVSVLRWPLWSLLGGIGVVLLSLLPARRP